MYFESRVNRIENISNLSIKEQVETIQTLGIGRGVKINHQVWINDANPSGAGINEVAVLLEKESLYFQFESITVPWCKALELETFINDFNKLEYLEKNYEISKIEAKELNNENSLTWFDCGCCNSGFQSTIKVQKQFDQDAGYGICSNCSAYYS